jgi:hypothetical protein
MKRQRLPHRHDINFLSPDGKVAKAKGFISLYNNGIIYINKELSKHFDKNTNFMKIGIDEDRKLLVLQPSKTPINSFKVEKHGNTMMVRHVPTRRLKIAIKNRLEVYATKDGFLSSLI